MHKKYFPIIQITIYLVTLTVSILTAKYAFVMTAVSHQSSLPESVPMDFAIGISLLLSGFHGRVLKERHRNWVYLLPVVACFLSAFITFILV